MKTKMIMLVTFLLLAVLTIGAASAEDNNATSDDLQVADEVDDVIGLSGFDSSEHSIEVTTDEMCIDEDDDDYYEDSVVDISLPGNAKGIFRVLNGEVIVAQTTVNNDDDEHWDVDEDGAEGSLYLDDFELTKIHDGDNLTFMFCELKSGQYVPFDALTVTCKVSLTGSVMQFYDISGGIPDVDVCFEVQDINLNRSDENFAFVNVTEREGILIITVETDNEDYEVFKEDLKTTERKYTEYDDELGDHYYCFAFSLDDLNNYTADAFSGDSFTDLIDKKIISSGDELCIGLYEDEDDPYSEIDSDSWYIIIKKEKILFDDDEPAVEVDCVELSVAMDEGWNETVVLQYTVKRGIKGKIVIYLNDDQTPAFERDLSDCEPVGYDPDDESDDYEITIADLNITEAGDYVLKYSFADENGVTIYSYDVEDPDTLVLYGNHVTTGDNATIWVNQADISVDEDQIIIKINATDVHADDEVIVYVDGNENPIKFNLAEHATDEEGIYAITSSQLNLGVGEHELNITCKGTNSLANVTILTDLVIDLADETVYTTFNDAFVFISLEENDITESSDICGMINVTLTDSQGTVLPTLQFDIDSIGADFELESLVIRTSDVGFELNGTYNVSVIYYDGNKGIVQEKGNVTFKEVGADDYGLSISDVIDNENIITFTNIPFDYDILVEIDGNEPVTFNKSSLSRGLDSQDNPAYFIKQGPLGLADGPHTISVSIDADVGVINLISVNVIVNLKQSVDPALNVSVADIEVGSAAVVVVTTNSTFSGNVTVEVAGENHTVNVDKGYGNVSVTGLGVGNYTAVAFFKSNDVFNGSIKNYTFEVRAKQTQPGETTGTVDPALNVSVADIEVGSAAVVVVTTNSTFSGNVTVEVAGENHTVNVDEGYGNVSVAGLGVGTYTAIAFFKSDEVFKDSIKNYTFEVRAKQNQPGETGVIVDPELTVSVADIEEGSAAIVAITTNSTFTGNVTVQVADKNYTVKVENGKGSISIADLKAGTYTATAFFKQTELFNASTKTATFKVTAKQTAFANKKEVVKVALKKVKVKKSAKKLVLKATVKVNGKAKKGLKVTFKIKGKKVGTKKTNKKGVAKLTLKKKALKKALKKAKVGKKIKIQATCKGTTKTIKVKVKK